MCGFVAFQGDSDVEPGKLRKLIRQISHRGPDDSGTFIDEEDNSGLGHCRLSIIDLEGGKQPLTKGDHTLIYNGELYNYREIRNQLRKKGRTFRTDSDTEVLLESYREWGTDCLRKFRGMFSFLLRNDRTNRLFLARDRFGQKPLYYSNQNEAFFAASEIQALLEFDTISRRVDFSALSLYLGLQFVPSPGTGFRDVKSLPPAHYMVVDAGEIREKSSYWDLNYHPKHELDYESVKENVRDTLRESVRLRMRSDVPVGAFLSGGVDSSIMVALMSEVSNKPVRTFSVRFDHDDFNELPVARTVAERYGTDHTELEVQADVRDVLPDLVQHYGEPFADSSALPVYYISRETSKDVKVALTGDGGDELFGGYGLYRKMRQRQYISGLLPEYVSRIFEFLASSTPHSDEGRSTFNKGLLALEHLSDQPGEWYYFLASYFTENQLGNLSMDPRIESDRARSFCRKEFEQYSHFDSEAEQAMAYDARRYLPEDLLFKVDVASMMNSLECRSPLLDHQVAEFAAKLPLKHKLGKNSGKKVLRDAFREILPEDVLNHPKTGFGIPRDYWIRNDLREYVGDNLFGESSELWAFLSRDYAESLFDQHLNESRNYGSQLWLLLMLRLWEREMQVTF